MKKITRQTVVTCKCLQVTTVLTCKHLHVTRKKLGTSGKGSARSQKKFSDVALMPHHKQ